LNEKLVPFSTPDTVARDTTLTFSHWPNGRESFSSDSAHSLRVIIVAIWPPLD